MQEGLITRLQGIWIILAWRAPEPAWLKSGRSTIDSQASSWRLFFYFYFPIEVSRDVHEG